MLINQPPFNTFHPSSLNIQTIRNIFESNLNPFFSQYNNKQILATDFTNINNGFINTLIKFIHTSRPDLLTLQQAPQSYHPPPQHPPPQKMGSNNNERPEPINTRAPNAYSQMGGTKEDYKTQNRDALNNAVASRAGEYITKQETTTSQQKQSDNGPVFEQSIPPAPSIEADDIQKLIMQRNYDVNPSINPNVVHQTDNVDDNDNNVNNDESLNGPTYINQTASLINDSGMNAEHMRMLEKHERDIEQFNNKLDNIQTTLTELSKFIMGVKTQKKTPPTPPTSPTQHQPKKKQKISHDKETSMDKKI